MALLVGVMPASGRDGDFASRVFAASASPQIKTLWLNTELKNELVSRFDYQLSLLRLRYWQADQRSAWILEEVGKEQPITFGIVIESDKIVSVEVLVYRESRGDEIQYPFFTDQFIQAYLEERGDRYRLSQNIDGITGATLSVRAMKKVAKVALFLHQREVSTSVNES